MRQKFKRMREVTRQGNIVLLRAFYRILVALLCVSLALVPASPQFLTPGVAISGGSSIANNTGVWLDGGVGAGDLTSQIVIYPDCTSSTPFQCTKLLRTDNTNNYIWEPCTTPSCRINGNNVGYGWVPLPLPANTTNTQMQAILNYNSAGQLFVGSLGQAACAWTTDQAQTLTGNTSDIFLILSSVLIGNDGDIYITTNKGVSWTDTRQSVLANPSGGNAENARENSPIVWCDPNSSGQVAYIGQYGGTLLKTTNGGTSWASVGGGLPTPAGNATEIVGDPTSSVVGGVTQGLYAWVAGSGLYASTNGGTSWTLVTATGAPSASAPYAPIKIDKFGQVWVQASTASSPIYKYSGGGAGGAWTNATGLCANNLVFVAFDSTSTSVGTERIYAWCGGNNGAYYSSDGGSTWFSLAALLSATVNSGGSGCTTGLQTFTVSGGTAIAAATFTGTVSGGSLSGALSVVAPGSYPTIPGGNPSVTGGGCVVPPSIVPNWTIDSINKTTSTNIPGPGDVPWLADGTSSPTFSDVHDAALDLAGNMYLASGYGVYYGAKNSVPVFTVQSVGYEESTNENVVIAARGLGFTQASWDTCLFANFVPTLYAWQNLQGGGSPAFCTQSPTVAGSKPWISCENNSGTGFAGCTLDGGHTFTPWAVAPAGSGLIATTDGTNILALFSGTLYCSVNGGGSWASITGPPASTPEIFEKSSGVYEYVASSPSGVWTSSGGCAGTWTEIFVGNVGFVSGAPGQINTLLAGQNFQSTDFDISTNGGVSWSVLVSGVTFVDILNVSLGAPKSGSSSSYTAYIVAEQGSTWGVWYSTDGGTTWNAVSSLGFNGYFGMIFQQADLAADQDIYGVVESAVNNLGNSVIGLTDSCPAVYWNPKITYPTMNVTGNVTLTAQDAGLAAPTSIAFKVDGTTIASFTPSAAAASYSNTWNSGSVTAGAHTLAVVSNGNGCSGVSKSIPITTH